MLILVFLQVLFVRHLRFGIAAYQRINHFLQYLLEIKGRDLVKRGLKCPSPQKKVTLACIACLLYVLVYLPHTTKYIYIK